MKLAYSWLAYKVRGRWHKLAQVSGEISPESRTFASKIARSIAEIQPSVNNMADVVVFLEVLGYSDSDAKKYGFDNLYSLGNYVYDFIDSFEERNQSDKEIGINVSSSKR